MMCLANISMEPTMGTSTSAVSLLYALSYFKSKDSMAEGLRTAASAQDRLIVGGGQAISNKIHE